MIHLTAFDIIATHDETIKRYGGLSGAVDPLKADVLIERVRNHDLNFNAEITLSPAMPSAA